MEEEKMRREEGPTRARTTLLCTYLDGQRHFLVGGAFCREPGLRTTSFAARDPQTRLSRATRFSRLPHIWATLSQERGVGQSRFGEDREAKEKQKVSQWTADG
jgi:hypothetical protein